jgi:ferredoxin-NADP reductase
MSVREMNALLYKPGHPADRLEKALRIPALGSGWHASFEALLERTKSGGSGNPGLAPRARKPPAWAGFRPLRVAAKKRESDSVTSLVLDPTDGRPLTHGLPGQFIVLRLRPAPDAPALLRSYSLSGEPSDSHYRVSVKANPNGVAGSYIRDGIRIGDVVDVAAPRGSFVLEPGGGPVILLSAGIGATPVLAMLDVLAEAKSPREVWWIHGTQSGAEHPFAEEVSARLKALPHSHRHICYSSPRPADRPAVDFDASGHVSVGALRELGVPEDADFYLCGPTAFMTDLTAGLGAWGVAANRIHSENFGAGPAMTPGIVAAPPKPPHVPEGAPGTGPLVSFARSGVDVRWGPTFQSILELAEACDVPVRWACRTGVCHSCETALVAGAVEYWLSPVEPPGDGNVLICCSKPNEDIVIDL